MKLSIITINYNDKIGLKRTIKSVVNQTYHDFEYIVIDGGSTDGSKEVINEYKNNISYWVSEPDKGIYNAMNKGLTFAKGDYCEFLNSGDSFASSTVVEQIVDCLGTADVYIGNANNVTYENGRKLKDVWLSPIHLTYKTLYQHTPNHQATFVRTSLLREIKGFDERFRILADMNMFYELFIRRNSAYSKLNLTVVDYCIGGISAKNIAKYQEEREWILKKYIPQIIIEDYDSVYRHPTKYTKYALYNGQFPLARKLSAGILYLISIPFRVVRRIKSL